MSAIELIDEIASYAYDPLGLVKAIFPWGEGELADSKGPRTWQAEELEAIGKWIRDPKTRYMPYQSAVASGHDIGKSALVGMLVKWALSCWPGARVMITANTGNQLSSKTQPEVSKWFRLAYDKEFWDVQATRISVRDAEYRANYRADFETWSEYNTEAFAGLHNQGKLILVIFDEASAINRPIWEVTRGALTDEKTVILWLVFGNPTRNDGPFFECFGSQAHRWRHKHIDSRTVDGVNKAQIEKWIEDYGEDSDFVRVRVRGEFPRAGGAQFIPSDLVAAARKYRAEGYGRLPKILSVDVARFGDDQTVIGTRQGRKAAILGKYRGKDTVWVAEQVIRFMESEEPDAVVIDADGIGAGVIDHIAHRGFHKRLFEFHGGAPANDAAAYFNRRAECWGAMRDWLQSEAEIPDDPELAADLAGPDYGFSSKQQIQLERKEDMKKRGLQSPDCGDMLAMTFAVKVAPPKPKPKPVMQYPGESKLNWMA